MSFKNYKDEAIGKFQFLADEYQFELAQIREEDYGIFITYKKNNFAIYLGYEYREERFFYYLNDSFTEIPFWKFFQKFDSSLNWPDFMPKGNDFSSALDKNINYLKKYGASFLNGDLLNE